MQPERLGEPLASAVEAPFHASQHPNAFSRFFRRSDTLQLSRFCSTPSACGSRMLRATSLGIAAEPPSGPYVWGVSLNVGDIAPDFTLEGTEGTFTLSEHRGERVVLLFYPGDDTPTCTKQFSAYRDASEEMAELGATFVGISTQDVASKESLKAKYGLTTPLLADTDAEVSKAYGVYAKRFNVAKRTVFIVDEDGKIAHEHGNFMSISFDDVGTIKEALEKLPAPPSLGHPSPRVPAAAR